jgi:hypothetical protein
MLAFTERWSSGAMKSGFFFASLPDISEINVCLILPYVSLQESLSVELPLQKEIGRNAQK